MVSPASSIKKLPIFIRLNVDGTSMVTPVPIMETGSALAFELTKHPENAREINIDLM
jgi:hypothetical protein